MIAKAAARTTGTRAVSRGGRFQPELDRLRAARVFDLLDETYGVHQWRANGSPLDELIGTVLSQNTSNVNTARSFRSLRAAFPTWDAVRTAPEEAVIESIRCGGLARIKGPRIQAILDAIAGAHGRLSLDHIADLPIEAAKAEMTALHGVGPKTAARVLLFSLGRPAMPVDTHVHRVSRRIGLVPPKVSAEACQPLLEDLLGHDRDRILNGHLNLIAHGQQLCRAQRPKCEACPLQSDCDYYRAIRSSADEFADA